MHIVSRRDTYGKCGVVYSAISASIRGKRRDTAAFLHIAVDMFQLGNKRRLDFEKQKVKIDAYTHTHSGHVTDLAGDATSF